MNKKISFFDLECEIESKKITDLGAVKYDQSEFHSVAIGEFLNFIMDSEFLCGHNVIHFDMSFLKNYSTNLTNKIIDTLYLSPLLFPKKPYHKLLKNDKLQTEELNNPLNDSKKAKKLFGDEVNSFLQLDDNRKNIYYKLLHNIIEFRYFFEFIGFIPNDYDVITLIKQEYKGKICDNINLKEILEYWPVELAYSLALIGTDDQYSVTPQWLTLTFPKIEYVIKKLRNISCKEGCEYCNNTFNIHKWLKRFYQYDSFRKYDGDSTSLQEEAVQAAVDGESLLAVFPTGGGKSITFQLPALIAGKTTHGLTVVISPLQSLMKDQVDNLLNKGIEDAVTINGLMNVVERTNSIELVKNGKASILYISPEQLRSNTIEKLLLSRNIVRFVIDEAHCFSAWGQDFRVDYLYIAKFIKHLQKIKCLNDQNIPISCFTATAKPKVISDICDYFLNNLNIPLKLFASNATRKNLHYYVINRETDYDKYNTLRRLIVQKKCPTIVYVSRVSKSKEIAEALTSDGIPALPYNGKMESDEKIKNQEAFMNDDVSVIVATSAFGMGVDKSNVGLVIHYDISDSLENYLQEAGRAGRDQSLNAECYILFNNDDLDKHFVLLNQTKLSISQIQQIWKAVKELTQNNDKICCSALEIARQAGWDDNANSEMEIRVKTALTALENAGYISRGKNVPKVYATSIAAKNMTEAAMKIRNSKLFSDEQKTAAIRVVKSLISSRSIANAKNDDAESRVDYLADVLGLEKSMVVEVINLMREEGILQDYNDMAAYINVGDNQHKSKINLDRFYKIEKFILDKIDDGEYTFNFKILNEEAQKQDLTYSTIKRIKTILYFLSIKNYIVKNEYNGNNEITITPTIDIRQLIEKFNKRIELCYFILDELYSKVDSKYESENDLKPVEFSLVGLLKSYQNTPKIDYNNRNITQKDVEDALLYLSKIGSLKLDGGFLVVYNGMEIKRIIKDNRIKYKIDDYRLLDDFYKQKIQQIHIVGEYANLMVKDYTMALEFVNDYFHMEFKKFIFKYFKDERVKQIERNITPERYTQLFGDLSDIQEEIINDTSKYIVVAAGPGSGKTRVLVHKLAALYQLEDVKHEQMLMLTFSRAATTEFKKRLHSLIGNAAFFIEIKTFHSYCFDLLGKIGTIETSDSIVKDAAEMIRNGEVEQGKITKTVLVIDEAQDMDEDEYSLIRALMFINDDMRIIAVGDDDQNIYEFRGSDSKYLTKLIEEYGAKKYEMVENYRSKRNIIKFANEFANTIQMRIKSKPIVPVTNENGFVKITEYNSNNFEQALVYELCKNNDLGSTCILTNTNDEALQIVGLLNEKGKKARLIQNLENFNLLNLFEIYHFVEYIKKYLETPIISIELWGRAKKFLNDNFNNSSCIDNIRKLVSDFEATHEEMYISDLEEFIFESKFDDFYTNIDEKIIYVSTIHKSKGREFDNVYLFIKDSYVFDDKDKRKLYVGITRAKTNLYIHTNTNIFKKFESPNVLYCKDNKTYDEPSQIIIQTTHKDVFLGFFKDRKNIINQLHAGQDLNINGDYLSVNIDGKEYMVARFSKSFIQTLNKLSIKGYNPIKAKIRFIVYWKDDTEDPAVPIILSSIKFIKE